MRHSYNPEDVIFLLKDVRGLVEELDTEERERRIQSGTPYSQMLPVEHEPSEEYLSLFRESLEREKCNLARCIGVLANKIYEKKGKEVVLVSLARGGTPIGILVKRFLKIRYGLDVPHYSISIIRGEGLDVEAMQFICQLHRSRNIQFVDGWVGKGAVGRTLEEHCNTLRKCNLWAGLDSELAVLSDPANTTNLYGSQDDMMIPSACLNATVSGLISRTVSTQGVIGEGDYHGAVYYSHLEHCDYSNFFVDSVTEEMENPHLLPVQLERELGTGLAEVKKIAKHYGVKDINKIKPGIGETTRVLLRRVPWKVLVNNLDDRDGLEHIFRLCEERGIEVEEYPLRKYRVCGIIKKLADV